MMKLQTFQHQEFPGRDGDHCDSFIVIIQDSLYDISACLQRNPEYYPVILPLKDRRVFADQLESKQVEFFQKLSYDLEKYKCGTVSADTKWLEQRKAVNSSNGPGHLKFSYVSYRELMLQQEENLTEAELFQKSESPVNRINKSCVRHLCYFRYQPSPEQINKQKNAKRVRNLL